MRNPFRKKRPSPKKSDSIESYGVSGEIAFSNADRTWEEKYHLIEGLARELEKQEIPCEVVNEWVVVDEVIFLRPEMLSFQPLEPNGMKTTSVIHVYSDKLCNNAFFEYQHSSGDETQQSFDNGFEAWIKIDLPAIRDSIRTEASECMVMEMSFDDGRKTRRAVLSPVSHLATEAPAEVEDHPFCPCCMLTQSFEAFKPQFEKGGIAAIRLLAARDENGNVSADCRINGVDFPEGEAALMSYAKSWPYRGYEMRKQYVVIHSTSAL